MRHLWIWLACSLALPAAAEDDGEELLAMMQRAESRDVAMEFVDAVVHKWNTSLFCLPEENPRRAAFAAVKTYLEDHPELRFRPRRYLITEGLKTTYPCRQK